MKFLPFLFAALFALSISPLGAAIERSVTETFQVKSGGKLTISTFGGAIQVKPGSGDVVTLEIKEKIDASSEKEADEVLKKLNLTKEQNGADVSVVAKYEGEQGFHFSWGSWSWPPVRVDIVATVPANYSVDLKTSGGGISVGNLHGAILASTAGGGLHFANIEGDISAKTSGGSIDLESCSGKVYLHTSGGSISAGTLVGPAELNSSAGSIRVKSAQNVIVAHSSAGSVTVGFEGKLAGDSTLTSSAGSVAVTVPADSDFVLDASSSAGSVKCSLPVTLDGGERSHIFGKVGAGGPKLKLRSSAGGIKVST